MDESDPGESDCLPPHTKAERFSEQLDRQHAHPEAYVESRDKKGMYSLASSLFTGNRCFGPLGKEECMLSRVSIGFF